MFYYVMETLSYVNGEIAKEVGSYKEGLEHSKKLGEERMWDEVGKEIIPDSVGVKDIPK